MIAQQLAAQGNETRSKVIDEPMPISTGSPTVPRTVSIDGTGPTQKHNELSKDFHEFEMLLDAPLDENVACDQHIVLVGMGELNTSNAELNSSFTRRGSFQGRMSSFKKERRVSSNSVRSKLSAALDDDDASAGTTDSMDIASRRMSNSTSQLQISKAEMVALQELFESSDMP